MYHPYSIPLGVHGETSATEGEPELVRALFSMDRWDKESIDGETRKIVKDLLKQQAGDGNWSTFDPLWERYKGFWCSKMTPRMVAYIFRSCFPDEGPLYPQQVQDAGGTYEMFYGVIVGVKGAKVSGEDLEQIWAARDVPRPKTVAGY